MISEETIHQVKQRTSIVKVVGERVKLERAGRSYKGLCPFHKEKSPSFHVNEERNFYHCFGCQAHGDAIRFVQETEGMSFVEAVRELAGRLGIDVVENRSDQERRQELDQKRRQEELYSVSEVAARYFEQCLQQHPLRALAHAELARRGLVAESPSDSVATTLAAFRLGYAPYGWDGLAKHLSAQGVSPVAAEKVGLLAPRRTGVGHYDRFRHRLMFGVVDLRGRVIAFSGRSLSDPSDAELRAAGVEALANGGDEPAKYINSPESPIYKKRETVFGLFQARNAARQADSCVLVEGNFDVVSLHARGLENVVAPLGTAFTVEQATQIRRYTQHVIVLFDGDAAGKRATASAREPCQQAGLTPRVARLPDGVDPDDLVRRQGPDALRACLRSSKGMLDHLIEQALDSGFSAADPQTQGAKIQEVLELIKAEADPTVRALAQAHADTIASRLGIADARTMQALSRAVRQAGGAPAHEARGRGVDRALEPRRGPAPSAGGKPSRHAALDRDVLGTLVEYPSLLDDAEVQPLIACAAGELALGVAVLAQCGHAVGEHLASFPESLRPLVAKHVAAPTHDDEATARRVLLENLGLLRGLEHKAQKAHLEDELRAARSTGDHEREVELLRELMQLSRARLGDVG